MQDSSLVDHTETNLIHLNDREANISELITHLKQCNLSALDNILSKEIRNEIRVVPIPISNIKDKIT